ncbi:MAG: hypothetical protein ACREM1_14430 [Longimicrobiales bacterium]
MTTREQKLRQAAFTYLHVGVLYEAAVWVAWRNELVSPARGPIWMWLGIGAAVVAVVFWLLWYRRSQWTARVIWALHTLRLPALIQGAFVPGAAERLSPTFYLVALIIVLINLVMLARAGWDL